MRKKTGKIATGIIIVAVILLITGITVMNQFFCRNEYAEDRYGMFWDDPGEYDVWFLGSSHTYYAVHPMDLWQSYGITSYDIATPSSTLPMTYWTLMCALERGTPEVVFVDVYHTDLDKLITEMPEKVHIGLDAIPLSTMKIRAVDDLFETFAEKREHLIPLYKKDGKWAEYIQVNEDLDFPLARGAMLMADSESISSNTVYPKDDVLTNDTLGTVYLRKIINECRERDINLVITAFPYTGDEIKQQGLHSGIKIAEEEGVPFIDLSYCPELVDYRTDFAEDGHLNIAGSRKTTSLIGKYLEENYELADHRQDEETAASWNEDRQKLKKEIAGRTKKTNSLKKYLIWMRHSMYDPYIYIKDGAVMSGRARTLLSGLDYRSIDRNEAEKMTGSGDKMKNDIVIIATDADTGEIIEAAGFNYGIKAED